MEIDEEGFEKVKLEEDAVDLMFAAAVEKMGKYPSLLRKLLGGI
jgi:hypothetical protein